MTSESYNSRSDSGSRPPRKPRTGAGAAPSRGDERGGKSFGQRSERPRFGGNDRPRPDADDRPRVPREVGPEIDEDVDWRDLHKEVKLRLRTLSKDNAEGVGGHLIMAGRLMDSEPELAYEHAKAAVKRAGRVDVVREALAIAAYTTGRYQEALHEFRTVRRLNGSSEHLALMADSERGLGRPERAIALAQSPEAETLSGPAKIELAIVVAGARADLGEAATGLVSLERIKIEKLPRHFQARVQQAQNYLREMLGKPLIEVVSADDSDPNDQEFVVHNLSWGIDDTPDIEAETESVAPTESAETPDEVTS